MNTRETEMSYKLTLLVEKLNYHLDKLLELENPTKSQRYYRKRKIKGLEWDIKQIEPNYFNTDIPIEGGTITFFN